MDIRDHPDYIQARLGGFARIDTQSQQILLPKLFRAAFRDHDILDVRRRIEREVTAELASLQRPDAQRLQVVEVDGNDTGIDGLVLIMKSNAEIAEASILADPDIDGAAGDGQGLGLRSQSRPQGVNISAGILGIPERDA